MLKLFRTWTRPASVSAVALAALVTINSPLATAAVADDDSFYIPPETLPAGNPGDIIRSRVSKAGPPTARKLADAWQVMYRSTNSLGDPVAMTGTVLVPKSGNLATMPIIAFAPGTSGPAFRCTPSRMLNKGAFYEQATINEMLAEGYAVAMADYEGYQPNPRTTYMVESMGPAVLDVVRAAKNLSEAGLSQDAKVMFRGYSQGGAAVTRAGQMQPDYAPDLDLIGVVAGGVPANLSLVALSLNGKSGFGFMVYALRGQDYAYPEVSLDPVLTDEGRAIIEDLEKDACVIKLTQGLQGKTIEDLVVPGAQPFDSARLLRLAELELGKKPIEAPVFQYHDIEDGVVAFPQASTLRDKYCEMGVDLEWFPMDSKAESGFLRHVSGVAFGNERAMEFIRKRVAGQPTESNCP